MPAKRYKVTLTSEERTFLLNLISKGKVAAQKLTKAHILLKSDQSEGQSTWTDQQISDAIFVRCATIERVRKTFVEAGMESTLSRKKHSCCGYQKFDGEKEAHLIALACSEPPPGEVRWTAQLLADKMVELNHFESISFDPVRLVLKKKRTETLAQKTMVYSTWCFGRICVCYGRYFGSLPTSLLFNTSADMYR
jgi:hypothetical protein